MFATEPSRYDDAIRWERARGASGDLKEKDVSVFCHSSGKLTAVASIGRDLENLKAELALEQGERDEKGRSVRERLFSSV
jgi:hypothetical protein